MTATRDRRSDPDAANEDEPVPWDERLVFGARRGLPWWGAVLLALVTAIAGAVLSTQVTDGLGLPFQLIYVAGALVAVAGVRRRNLFGPMVQPPLVMAVAVPLVVLTGTSLPESNDMLADVLAVSTPLINNFPVMAIATALTVALGVLRIYRERDPDRPVKDTSKRPRDRDSDGADERPATPKDKRPAKGKAPGGPAAAAGAGAAAGRPAGDSGTSGRQRKPRPPEDRPDGAAGRGEPGRGEPGRGEPQRRGRPGDGPPGRGPRGPEDAPRRPRPADQERGPRTPPPAERRPPRPPRTPPEAGAGPKRPQRPPRGERPEPPQRPKRPRGAEPPPGRDQPRRRPWDAED